MRITALEIRNIRAIDQLALEKIPDVVLIAGPNGCGKSCIFDALRLLKSSYGGYEPNEWQQWFGEYGININKKGGAALAHLHRDTRKPISIEAQFELTPSEREYLTNNLDEFTERLAWEIVAPHTQGFGIRPVARDIRTHQPQVDKMRADIANAVSVGLKEKTHLARLEVKGSDLLTHPNPLLEVVFSAYQPEHIGIIDFHGANRVFQRENLGNINLAFDSDEKGRQGRLYNYTQKYANIKSEMASSYVRELIAKELGHEHDKKVRITETLKELFRTFFPDKEFLGPVPMDDQTLSFPVKVGDGIVHDINDLSSGEKEVLFGYLRLRNASPKNSVILLDEPEMHLNPGLIKGLPQFYKRHIGEEMNNQLWLVTHSDAFLREAVGQPGFEVYHMRHASDAARRKQDNQLAQVRVEGEVEQAVIDLVGDLATFNPGVPVVIFEGENSEFDVRMTCRLFPELQSATNPISAGNKTNAQKLHGLLCEAGRRAALTDRFFSIVDKDQDAAPAAAGSFCWPAYHIENFLLDGEFIYLVLLDLFETESKFDDGVAVEAALKECAKQTMDSLVKHKLQNAANAKLLTAISIGLGATKEPASALASSIKGVSEKLQALSSGELSLNSLALSEAEERLKLSAALGDDSWKLLFRGRDVLKRFVAAHCGKSLKYESLRDLIVARMRDHGHRPAGMASVVDTLLKEAGVKHQPNERID